MIDISLWEKRKKELNLTFDQLSKLSGIPKRTILGIFRGEVHTPRIDTVQAIEKTLGIDQREERKDEPKIALYEGELSEQSMESIKKFIEFIKEQEKQK